MSVDFGMRQSLAEAGLVDPSSGEFTSAPNFGAAYESEEPARQPLPEEKDAPESQPAEKQNPASVPQVQPGQSAPRGDPGTDPDNRGMPSGQLVQADAAKLGEADDPIRSRYDQTVSTMRQQAQMAFMQGQQMVNEKGERVYSDEQLAQFLGSQLQNAEQQVYLHAVMERMQPVAKRAAAEKMAKDYGVEVDDIINEANPVAMETRAKTIADLTRQGRFEKRKAAGTDTAEGSRNFSNAIPEGIDKLSPQQKIYAGLARGDH
jgi:hypothetical protein